VKSLYLDDDEIEAHNWKLKEKYRLMEERETRFESYRTEGAKVVLIAFGTAARVCKTAVQLARAEGIAAGLLRPITLFPFPEAAVRAAAEGADATIVVEMNTGQMVEDVLRSTPRHERVRFHGRPCAMPIPEEILGEIRRAVGRNPVVTVEGPLRRSTGGKHDVDGEGRSRTPGAKA
jgi:2-oxoglutarate ferredoxin oxidoreductase subunit alpha